MHHEASPELGRLSVQVGSCHLQVHWFRQCPQSRWLVYLHPSWAWPHLPAVPDHTHQPGKTPSWQETRVTEHRKLELMFPFLHLLQKWSNNNKAKTREKSHSTSATLIFPVEFVHENHDFTLSMTVCVEEVEFSFLFPIYENFKYTENLQE